MKFTKCIAQAIGVAALSGGALLVAPAAHAVDPPCSWYAGVGHLYYNHCGSGSVWVDVKNSLGVTSDTVCLPPGETDLGELSFSRQTAWSAGEPC